MSQIQSIIEETQPRWTKENSYLFALFVVSVFVVYFLPFAINQLFFIIIVALSYNTKKDYFWLAFFFILMDAPGRLFTGGDIADTKRLAFYSFSSGITLQFNDILMLVLLMKVVLKKGRSFFVFRRDIVFLLVYAVLVMLYSSELGMNNSSLIQTLRILFSWSLFFIIPGLLLSEEDYNSFNRLIFPFVFVAIASQIYTYLEGNYFAYVLKGVALVDQRLLRLTENSSEAMRASDSSFILLYSFTMSLFYMFSKKNVYDKKYLAFVIGTAALSVLLSATRGWIIAFAIILFLTWISTRSSKKYLISLGISSIVVVLIMTLFIPAISYQLGNTFERLETLAAIAKGDVTAEGSLARMDVRGPKVMAKFWENPLLGWGFSNKYYDYTDMHVGQQNMLLNLGIVGFAIFSLIFVKWCFRIYLTSKAKPIIAVYGKNHINILLFSLLGLYFIHTTSSKAWGYDISMTHLFFYSLILQFFNLLYKKAKMLNPIKTSAD